MPISNKTKTLRRRLASDLERFSRILNNHITNCDLSPISKAVSQLSDEKYVPQMDGAKQVNYNNWGYDINGISFTFQSLPEHTHPKEAYNLSLIFDITLIADALNFNEIRDPYSLLEFNIVIKGNYIDTKRNDTLDLICSFHLDKHLDNKVEAKYPHPDYHFQFGGRKLDKGQKDFGCGLFLDSPRIVHHPMDIILGIDFILSNFFPEDWKKLRRDGEYVNIIRQYQEYFWRPYAHSKAWNWPSYNPQGIWSPITIWPQLISARTS